jgi:hypothetical protein
MFSASPSLNLSNLPPTAHHDDSQAAQEPGFKLPVSVAMQLKNRLRFATSDLRGFGTAILLERERGSMRQFAAHLVCWLLMLTRRAACAVWIFFSIFTKTVSMSGHF